MSASGKVSSADSSSCSIPYSPSPSSYTCLPLGCVSGLLPSLNALYSSSTPTLSHQSSLPALHYSHYFLLVENLCESPSHPPAASPVPFDMDHSVERAFFQPGVVIAQTPVDWSATRPITSDALPRLWCRWLRLYVDWASHVPSCGS